MVRPLDATTAYKVELGRAAFRTPLLLGGQAARAGLSCESCHRSGRDNPEFDFPGISGAPGSADVGTSVLSSHRGGRPLTPVPIPNLSGSKTALKTDQDPRSGALAARIDTIATQEFDGAEPPPAVLEGLATYVRTLSPASCPTGATEPLTAAGALADVRRAVRAGLAALGHGDGAAAALMVEAARSQLGDIDERYAGQELAPERAALRSASSDLAAAEFDARHDPSAARQSLELWLAREPSWTPRLMGAEPRSLYAPSRLAAAERPAP